MTFDWRVAHGRVLELGREARIMAILNMTPDSFSDGGSHSDVDRALQAVEAMIGQGATIIDVGGESTRPGAAPVDQATEQARILPIIAAIQRRFDCLISVDTYRALTAERAIAAGAHIVNDVWGLQKEPAIAEVAARTGAGLVIMYTSREREPQPDIMADRGTFLAGSLRMADEAGVDRGQIVLDPGFGFGRDPADDIPLMARMAELQALAQPLLIGTSRKRFLGTILHESDPLKRDIATSATSVALRLAGGAIFRVHNVAFNRDALAVADAILQSRDNQE